MNANRLKPCRWNKMAPDFSKISVDKQTMEPRRIVNQELEGTWEMRHLCTVWLQHNANGLDKSLLRTLLLLGSMPGAQNCNFASKSTFASTTPTRNQPPSSNRFPPHQWGPSSASTNGLHAEPLRPDMQFPTKAEDDQFLPSLGFSACNASESVLAAATTREKFWPFNMAFVEAPAQHSRFVLITCGCQEVLTKTKGRTPCL